MRTEVPHPGGKWGEGGGKQKLFFLNLGRTELLPQTLGEEKERGEKW